jgi:hypothetical protein
MKGTNTNMKCCGQEAMGVELQVDGQPFVLHRCGECESSIWTCDGTAVAFEYVTGAMAAETARRPPQMQALQP